MCDERYGRELWGSIDTSRTPDSIKMRSVAKQILSGESTSSTGFAGQEDTTPFLVAACKMGNYHCDVVYCKETYCKDKDMVKKYGHWLEDLGWSESTESWLKA